MFDRIPRGNNNSKKHPHEAKTKMDDGMEVSAAKKSNGTSDNDNNNYNNMYIYRERKRETCIYMDIIYINSIHG